MYLHIGYNMYITGTVKNISYGRDDNISVVGIPASIATHTPIIEGPRSGRGLMRGGTTFGQFLIRLGSIRRTACYSCKRLLL